ncbi:MAG: pyridine nucleotide-disulfide oxidoreductase [Hyphomonadaceae bacterium]|nr:pyridine nucleotide-disulfide oxidoreductase [Hyphomonadaceae bacterium]
MNNASDNRNMGRPTALTPVDKPPLVVEARMTPPSPEKTRANIQNDRQITIVAFSAVIVALLYWGWTNKGEAILEPARGFGYALGIAGSVLMLALLAYPLRKRLKFMRSWGPVAAWFRWHMVLGIVGPALIILHSNYTLQSANAAVAFWVMIVVASSGLIGRYLYARVHRGLYGQKAEAREYLEEAVTTRSLLELGADRQGHDWNDELADFEKRALSPHRTFFGALGGSLAFDSRARRVRKILFRDVDLTILSEAARRNLSPTSRKSLRDASRQRLDRYFRALGRAVHLAVYDRLFSLWHVLHLPLFVILILTAIIHIVAVHLY